MVKYHSDRERGHSLLPHGLLFLRLDWIGNGIYVSISMNGSDTPVTRPETNKAGLSSRDRKKKKAGGSLGAIEILNTVEKHEWTIKKKPK